MFKCWRGLCQSRGCSSEEVFWISTMPQCIVPARSLTISITNWQPGTSKEVFVQGCSRASVASKFHGFPRKSEKRVSRWQADRWPTLCLPPVSKDQDATCMVQVSGMITTFDFVGALISLVVSECPEGANIKAGSGLAVSSWKLPRISQKFLFLNRPLASWMFTCVYIYIHTKCFSYYSDSATLQRFTLSWNSLELFLRGNSLINILKVNTTTAHSLDFILEIWRAPVPGLVRIRCYDPCWRSFRAVADRRLLPVGLWAGIWWDRSHPWWHRARYRSVIQRWPVWSSARVGCEAIHLRNGSHVIVVRSQLVYSIDEWACWHSGPEL